MYSIPVQTAIVSSLVGNAVLAGIFLFAGMIASMLLGRRFGQVGQ